MPAIQIKDLRLSFIWVETVLDLLNGTIPKDATMPFLGSSQDYADMHERLAKDEETPLHLKSPWHASEGRSFWTFYLDSKTPPEIIHEKAWKSLVPFRGAVPVKIIAPYPKWRFVAEAFYYPHGLGLVITAICSATLSLYEAVNQAFGIHGQQDLDFEWKGGPVNSKRLDSIATKCLTELRKAAFGQKATPAYSTIIPFTVFSVVRGEGASLTNKMVAKSELHRALEAVTGWQTSWASDPLPGDFSDAVLKAQKPEQEGSAKKKSPNLLYGRDRGRAIWRPASFSSQGKKIHTLGCYHRNVVFAALQVESLGDLVSLFAKDLHKGKGPSLPLPYRDCAQFAARILRRFYKGIKPGYKSISARYHIEHKNLINSIKDIRDYFGDMPVW
jgi:hypothetical protein